MVVLLTPNFHFVYGDYPFPRFGFIKCGAIHARDGNASSTTVLDWRLSSYISTVFDESKPRKRIVSINEMKIWS